MKNVTMGVLADLRLQSFPTPLSPSISCTILSAVGKMASTSAGCSSTMEIRGLNTAPCVGCAGVCVWGGRC